MKTEIEIERAIITLLCAAYDKGVESLGYCSFEDGERDKWVRKQMKNLKNWWNRDSCCVVNKKEVITKKWLVDHNFKRVVDDSYSYQGGGEDLSFMVGTVSGKWYAEIGDGFAKNPACGLKNTEELEGIFFLLTGKNMDIKKYKEPTVVAHSIGGFHGSPCNPPRPGGR